MSKPLISIVTPVYNGERYIGETIDSIASQNMPIEHIVIDDGSSDYTGHVVNDRLKRIKNNGYSLKFYRQENAGEQEAVNVGLKMVEGRYYMIVNADDPLLPKAVESLYYALERNTNHVAVYPDWQMIDESGKLIKYMQCPEWDMNRMVREHRCIPSVGVMYRSELLEVVGYRDTNFLYIGDFDYFYRVGLAGDYIHLPQTLACWRKHRDNLTAIDNPVRAEQRKLLVDKFFSLPGSELYFDLKDEAYCWSYLVAAAESKNIKRRFNYIRKAVRSYPAIMFTLHFWYSLYKYARYYLKVRI